MRSTLVIFSLLEAFAASTARAEAPVVHHLTLVGVISDGSSGGQGVAVIRDQANQKTVMLKRGEVLPDGSGLIVQTIDRKFVLASNGERVVRLEHDLSKPEEPVALNEQEAAPGDDEDVRSELERLLRPLMRRTIAVPTNEGEEPVSFERLQAELLEASEPEWVEDKDAEDEASEASGH